MTKAPAACLIGWPAAHSRSPLIHHYWLRTLGIAGGYVIEAVPPEDLRDFVLRLSLRGFVGGNVTIPHKEGVLAFSTPDARAKAVGAANTLWFADGELRSTNTDVEGFINNLDAGAPGWDRAEQALVLGAGGAVARGRVRSARTRRQPRPRRQPQHRAGRGAREQFGPNVHPISWDGIDDMLPRARTSRQHDLAWHARPASTRGRCGATAASAVVADLVYVPLETPLLAAARARGLKTADGLGMLLHQAVRGFELWFGREAGGHGGAARAGRGRSSTKDLK